MNTSPDTLLASLLGGVTHGIGETVPRVLRHWRGRLVHGRSKAPLPEAKSPHYSEPDFDSIEGAPDWYRVLRSYSNDGQHKVVLDLGPHFLPLAPPGVVRLVLYNMLSASAWRCGDYEQAYRFASAGLRGCKHPILRLRLLSNLAIAHNRRGNRDQAEAALLTILKADDRHMLALYNLLCIAAKYEDTAAYSTWGGRLARAYESACADPKSFLGNSILSDPALEAFRNHASFAESFPALAAERVREMTGHERSGFTKHKPFIVAIALAALLVLAGAAGADMSNS